MNVIRKNSDGGSIHNKIAFIFDFFFFFTKMCAVIFYLVKWCMFFIFFARQINSLALSTKSGIRECACAQMAKTYAGAAKTRLVGHVAVGDNVGCCDVISIC